MARRRSPLHWGIVLAVTAPPNTDTEDLSQFSKISNQPPKTQTPCVWCQVCPPTQLHLFPVAVITRSKLQSGATFKQFQNIMGLILVHQIGSTNRFYHNQGHNCPIDYHTVVDFPRGHSWPRYQTGTSWIWHFISSFFYQTSLKCKLVAWLPYNLIRSEYSFFSWHLLQKIFWK